MKHIASCSFGKDSLATILLALEHGEPLDEAVYCEVMFDKTISGEVPEHRDFIYNTALPRLEQMGHLMCPHEILTVKGYALEDYWGTEWEKRYLDCVNDPRIEKRSVNKSIFIDVSLNTFYRSSQISSAVGYIASAVEFSIWIEIVTSLSEIEDSF